MPKFDTKLWILETRLTVKLYIFLQSSRWWLQFGHRCRYWCFRWVTAITSTRCKYHKYNSPPTFWLWWISRIRQNWCWYFIRGREYLQDITSDISSAKRFRKIIENLHCKDNDKALPTANPQHDKLHKVRPRIHHLSESIAKTYKHSSLLYMCRWINDTLQRTVEFQTRYDAEARQTWL